MLAYAHITSNGSVDELNSSKAFVKESKEATVKEAEAGIYCITGLASFTPHNVVATIDANETNEVAIPLLSATIGQGPEAICPAGTQITVETWKPVLEKNAKGEEVMQAETVAEGFYIAIN